LKEALIGSKQPIEDPISRDLEVVNGRGWADRRFPAYGIYHYAPEVKPVAAENLIHRKELAADFCTIGFTAV
jgi:hypothetical protein